MKKFLLIAIVAVLIATGSMFAFTFTSVTATIGVTATGSDFAAVTTENMTALTPTVFGDYVGSWSSGALFSVTPDSSYTGDLIIRVSLINTGELSRCYEHLNMALEFWDDDDAIADEHGITQVLNLENSEVIFTWANGTGTSPFKVQLIGGGYRLHPWKSLSGASVQPQLWLEIAQR